MVMQAGQQWHCTNPACRCEVLVQSTSAIEGGNPRCVCGAAMKRSYTGPTFSYLEFLKPEQLEKSLAAHTTAREHSRAE
jgi:hypothetical protein